MSLNTNHMLHTDFPPNQNCMPRSRGQRLFSAIFAIGISVLFLVLLNRDFITKVLPSTSLASSVMLLNFLQKTIPPIKLANQKSPLPVRRPATDIPPQKKLVSNKKSPTREITSTQNRPETSAEVSPEVSAEVKAQTELINVFPETPKQAPISNHANTKLGSSTFKYDSASVRLAYEASKSDIQKMAEKSGTALEDPKTSKHDKFQNAAERAVKPDCLRQGGSILSLFVIAYQAATDHCK